MARNITVEDALRMMRKMQSGGGSGTGGVSPTVSVIEITGGHRISITDINGTKTFDVMDGKDGKDGTGGSAAASYDEETGELTIYGYNVVYDEETGNLAI